MLKKVKFSLSYLLIILAFPLAVLISRAFPSRQYYIACTAVAVLTIAAFFVSFESSKPSAQHITLLAVLTSLAVGGRIAFAAIPFVKPVAAVIIITGAVLGAQSGFMCGCMTMLASNFMFGQGPWTVWQMLAFGLMGFVSGIVFYSRKSLINRYSLSFFGFFFYLLITGPLLDISGMLAFTAMRNASVKALLLAGFPVNLVASVSTLAFLFVLSVPLIAKLDRVIAKYGLLSPLK